LFGADQPKYELASGTVAGPNDRRCPTAHGIAAAVEPEAVHLLGGAVAIYAVLLKIGCTSRRKSIRAGLWADTVPAGAQARSIEHVMRRFKVCPPESANYNGTGRPQ